MGDWKRWAPPAIAAVALLIGLFLLDWVVTSTPLGSLHLAPRQSDLCLGSMCAHVANPAKTWGWLSSVALGLGILSAVGLLIVAVMRFLGADASVFGKPVAALSAATAAVSVVALVAVAPDSFSDYSLGGLVTVVAALVGIGARANPAGANAFDGGRSAAPIRSTAQVQVPPGSAAPAKVAPAAALRAGPSSGGLRFVVLDGTITATGLTLRFDRQIERTIAWADLVEVAVRRMPPDPPYEKVSFLDLVVAGAPPARLLPTSRLEYAALPGGMAPNTRENWRRLVALARERNPAILVEAQSAEFFAGGRDAPMFPALKKFTEWDRRYDAQASD